MLLVANPFMQDPNFRRMVVLLVEHGPDGSLGYVLNRPLDAYIPQLVDQLDGFRAPLLWGGPVAPDTLHFLHRYSPGINGSETICPGLWWSGSFDQLVQMARGGRLLAEDFHFYLGYSGWAPGQLQQEQGHRSWLVTPATRELAWLEPANCWVQVVQQMGGPSRLMAHFPADPGLN